MRVSLKRALWGLVIVPALLCDSVAAAPQWRLAGGGKAEAVIVVAETAPAPEQHAAAELAHYLHKITGAEFSRVAAGVSGKVNIRLGTPASNPAIAQAGLLERVQRLAPDGFLLFTIGEELIIAANTPLGVLFGTYGLLEDHLGVRWFFPGEIGEYCPQQRELQLGNLDEVQEPSFRIREATWSRAGPAANTPEAWDWVARNRIQLHYDKRHHEEHIKRGATKRGGGHILGRMVPEQLFEEHPDYFGMYDGERRPYSFKWRSGQPCTSNPKVVELAVDYMLDWFAENPDGVFSLNGNDNRNYCECDACRALDPPEEVGRWGGEVSTRFFTFKNEVAKRVYAKYPEARIATLAYMPYRLPPAHKIELDPRIWIRLADHSRCFRHALNDPACVWNKQGTYTPAGGFLKMYQGWAEYANPRGNFPYYNMIAQYRSREVPEGGIVQAPIENIVAADIRFQHKLGHESWNMRLRPPEAFSPERHPPRTTMCWRANLQWYYLKAKLIWNTERDVTALLNDFYEKFYGPASDQMRSYHNRIRHLWEHTEGDYLYHSTFADLGKSMSSDDLKELRTLLDRAQHDVMEWTLLQDDTIYERRLADEVRVFEQCWQLAYELYQEQNKQK